jgi:hypothetical protein
MSALLQDTKGAETLTRLFVDRAAMSAIRLTNSGEQSA